MTDQTDIVTRLRAVLHNDRSVELMNRESADEIERLRVELDRLGPLMLRASVEIQQVRAERDELRRDWCHLWARTDGRRLAPTQAARLRGWDCFKGETS